MDSFSSFSSSSSKTRRLAQQKLKEFGGKTDQRFKDEEFKRLLADVEELEQELQKSRDPLRNFWSSFQSYIRARNQLCGVLQSSLGNIEHNSKSCYSATLAALNAKSGAMKDSSLPRNGSIFGNLTSTKSETEILSFLDEWLEYLSQLKTRISELEDCRLELCYYADKVEALRKAADAEAIQRNTDKLRAVEQKYMADIQPLKVELATVLHHRRGILGHILTVFEHEEKCLGGLRFEQGAGDFHSWPKPLLPNNISQSLERSNSAPAHAVSAGNSRPITSSNRDISPGNRSLGGPNGPPPTLPSPRQLLPSHSFPPPNQNSIPALTINGQPAAPPIGSSVSPTRANVVIHQQAPSSPRRVSMNPEPAYPQPSTSPRRESKPVADLRGGAPPPTYKY